MIAWIVCTVLLAVLATVLLERLAPERMARLLLTLERRRNRLALRWQTARGFDMAYLEGGRGEPLVLVHGFGGDKYNFVRVAGPLARRYRVIVPDLPGFGEATRDPAASYRIEDQVARLEAFLDALQLGRVHLGGNSMGGFIVAELAARHPQRVASLWLLDAAGVAEAHNSVLIRSYASTGEFPLLLKDARRVDQVIHAVMSRPPFFPYSVKRMLGLRGVADFALHSRIARQVIQDSPLLAARFARIETPSLIVWGEEDRVLDPAGVAAFRTLLPNARAVTLPGIGHVPMLEAPRRAVRDYLEFRTALEGTRVS